MWGVHDCQLSQLISFRIQQRKRDLLYIYKRINAYTTQLTAIKCRLFLRPYINSNNSTALRVFYPVITPGAADDSDEGCLLVVINVIFVNSFAVCLFNCGRCYCFCLYPFFLYVGNVMY